MTVSGIGMACGCRQSVLDRDDAARRADASGTPERFALIQQATILH